MLLVQLLGPLEARVDGHRLDLGGQRARAILALLALDPGRVVDRSALVDALWEVDPPVSAVSQVAIHISGLRKILGREAIETVGSGYRLHPKSVEVDARTVERLIAEARADHDPDRLSAALARWRGPTLSGLHSAVLEPGIRALEELRLGTLEDWAALESDRGAHRTVADVLPAAVAENPLREGLRAQLMEALWHCDRRAEALALFREGRELLVDELGIDPGPRLRFLHQRILAGEDPAHDAATVPVPAQLPPAAGVLSGRDRELAWLEGLTSTVAASPRTAVVTGTAGVGKTGLALTWAHQNAESFPDGQLYADMSGFSAGPPADSHEVLAGFNRALGGDEPIGGTSLQERSALFRSLTARRRILIVLDNVGSAEQVRPLLPGSPTCAVLVTSRLSLDGLAARDGAEQVRLEPLEPAESLSLLAELVGDRVRDHPDWRCLLDSCAHLPLAIRVAAEHVRAHPGQDITTLLGEIADGHDRLDLLDSGGDAGGDVRAVLSWSYAALAESSARVFRAFGVLRASTADLFTLGAVTALDQRTVRQAVADLARAHLVQESAPGWFTQHGLLRAYATERARLEDSAEDRTAARARLMTHYVAGAALAQQLIDPGGEALTVDAENLPVPQLEDARSAGRWLGMQVPNILASLDDAPPDSTRLYQLSQLLGGFLNWRGNDGLGVRIHRAALEAALREGDASAVASARRRLGTALAQDGDPEAGRALLLRALAAARAGGNLIEITRTQNNLGVFDSWVGDHALARERFIEVLELCAAEGADHLAVVSMANLSEVLVDLGRPAEALDQAQETLTFARRLDDEQVLAESFHVLAASHAALGDLDHAREFAHESLRVSRAAGDRRSQIGALRDIGNVQLSDGDHEGALAHFRSALEISRETGNVGGVAETMEACGRALTAAGSPDALSYLEEALSIARRRGLETKENELRRALEDAAQRVEGASPHDRAERP